MSLTVAFGLLAGTGLLHSPAAAQGKSGVKIAVLDSIVIRVRSKAGKSIATQLATYRKALQKDAEAQQNKLRAARNELRLQRSLLSPEAMQARERKFQDDFKAAQRRFQEQKKALDDSRIEASKAFDKHLTEILKKLQEEHKYDLILYQRPSVVFVTPEVSITKEVLQRFDKRVQHIAVKKPGTK
ncbi:MAG: OmpH family outer membrane protein [Alphaproteobacteria bacterium]|nr:OmpH family outer membrane protein [Alphaproteobacteria bacterium]